MLILHCKSFKPIKQTEVTVELEDQDDDEFDQPNRTTMIDDLTVLSPTSQKDSGSFSVNDSTHMPCFAENVKNIQNEKEELFIDSQVRTMSEPVLLKRRVSTQRNSQGVFFQLIQDNEDELLRQKSNRPLRDIDNS
jgi:hypothetical protein